MADIKTRDVVKGTIKKIDKAAIAADRSLVELKNALIRQGRYLRKGKAQGRIGQRCARQSDPN